MAAAWVTLTVAAFLASAVSQDAAGEGVQIFLDGKVIPANEAAALESLNDWLDRLHWTPGWEDGSASRSALAQLDQLAEAVPQAPWLALGLGQAIFLYFWWLGSSLEVDMKAGRLAATLHRVSIRFAGCDDPGLPPGQFKALQCAWRWRHAMMIPAELGLHVARSRGDPGLAAQLLREAEQAWELGRSLPHFQRAEWPSLHAVNTNSDFFPGQVNRPVWPTASVPFAQFLEANAAAFRADLDALLSQGLYDHLYWTGEVSLTQFAPKHEGWAMLSLIRNRKLLPKVCELAKASCALLESRSELMACTAGDAGAAFARLLPGEGLRPHFWNAPRLGAHLGLITPPGASMRVGGQEVVWEEGQAVVFDDTYIHSVLHEGTEARYLLIAWFCHPCDTQLASGPPRDPLCPTLDSASA